MVNWDWKIKVNHSFREGNGLIAGVFTSLKCQVFSYLVLAVLGLFELFLSL